MVRQSERRWRYDDALGRLHALGVLYACFCTRAEIREAASAPHGPLPEGAYPGTCAHIDAATRRARIERGEPFALRLRAGAQRIDFDDRLLGPQSHLVDDFVVVRSDGVHAYQLAVVVDDAEQQIGEVVRGADLLESTGRQILLQRLLKLPTPTYAHVPLVLGPSGARLAKRDAGATLADRAAVGQPAPRVLAELAHTLGIAVDRDRVDAAADLLDEFDPSRIPLEPVVLADPRGHAQ